MQTRIKICGITRLDDAQCADSLGVDAIGFVFVPASARYIEPAAAARLSASLPPFLGRIGLFLDAETDLVTEVLSLIPGLMPQFHGNEDAPYCDSFQLPYLKAIGVADGMPSMATLSRYRLARALLFDSHAPGELGGTGQRFDWSALGAGLPAPLVLAGGLDAGNVGAAIRQVRPYAVDVSSGVEHSRGIKDHQAMRRFVAAVRQADAALDSSPGFRTETITT